MAAKSTKKAEEPQTTAVATTTPGAVALPFDFGKMAGRGQENMTSQDQAIPFIGILQAQSPAVAKKDARIEGAQAGMFINTVTNEVFENFVFIPCATEHLYVEWRPRTSGGGFAGRHGLHSGIMQQTTRKETENGSIKNVLQNGNEIVETFYVIGMVLENADDAVPTGFAILAFTSSGITPYKKSIGELRKFPGAPLFAHRLAISTDQQSNAKGDWYNWVITPVNQPDGDPVFRNGVVASIIDPSGDQAALLEAGEMLCADFQAGTANVAYESQEAGGGGEAAAGDKHF